MHIEIHLPVLYSDPPVSFYRYTVSVLFRGKSCKARFWKDFGTSQSHPIHETAFPRGRICKRGSRSRMKMERPRSRMLQVTKLTNRGATAWSTVDASLLMRRSVSPSHIKPTTTHGLRGVHTCPSASSVRVCVYKVILPVSIDDAMCERRPAGGPRLRTGTQRPGLFRARGAA